MPEADHDEALGRAFDRRLVWRLARMARPHRRLILGSGALFPLIAAVELAQPYLVKVAVDEHILRQDWAGLTRVAALFVATLVVLYALRAAEAYLLHLSGQRVMHDLRTALFHHLLRLEARFFDRQPVGRLMTRVLNDPEAISEAFASGLFAVVGDVVTLVGVVAVMLWLDWRLALAAFSLVPVLALVAGWLRLRARDAYREVRRRLAGLNGFLQESLQGLTVIQLFAREAAELRRFRTLAADYRRAQFASTVAEATLYAVVEVVGSTAAALLIWYGGGRIAAGALSFGTLVAFLQYTNRFFLPIRDLGAKYTVMQSAMASAERIFALLDRRPTIASPAAPRIHARRPGPLPVALERAWFAYEDERWVLADCSLAVGAGEHVALVGATGEGKTTCVRLLNRFHDVQRGRVLVDGVDVREWDLRTLRQRVGLIFQDTVLFAGTVESNLRLGGDGAATRADLEAAVAAASATPLVEALPRGLGEVLGERGNNLSHGQRQLLAIARALVYNPAVLVLDEATSSVDPESEHLVRQAMNRLAAGRTTITIAHRLSSVQSADRILVLHRGAVAEQGTHVALLAHGGIYARLWEVHAGERAG